MNSTVVIKSWSEIGLYVNPNAVNVKTLCPACSDTRKSKKDKCLSVSPAKGVANCHNCSTTYLIETKPQKEYKKPEVKQSPLSPRLLKFFKDRHINETTLEYFRVTESRDWMYSRGEEPEGETPCINFNYYQGKDLVNVKFRASGKRFRMVAGAKLIFYNLDAIKDSDWCAIQEGEIDSMAAYQSGVYKSISVPNGASMGSNLVLEYLDNCMDAFKGKKKIIIATDNDDPGRALGEELIRRLGRARCYTIEYPEGCKDTNDVLIKHGERAVKAMYDNAQPLPLEGVFTAEQLNEGIMNFYRNGFPKGLRLGYKNFDELLTFRGGELTIATGIPGSGKSEFIDQIMIRLASRYGWRCGIFSPENQPSSLHAMSLLSKFLGGKTIGKDKVSEMKILKGSEFINDHFFFMMVDEIDVTIDGILDLAEDLVQKKGIKVLLIDPYNYIEHRIPHGQTETQYISELLTKLCNFCRRNDVHGFLIAHPVKIKKDKNGKYEVATLYDIAGCHDEETEVLTENGWVRHANLTRNEKVACFDLKSGEIEYMNPSHYHVYPFCGELKHFFGKAMDIAVTPNHRMVIKPHWALKPEGGSQRGRASKYESRDWQFVEAENVSKSPMTLPKSGTFKHLDLLPDRFPLDEGYNTNALFQLVGWYVSEGSRTMGSISICQRTENSVHLKNLISSLDLNVKEEETNYRRHEKPMYRFRIYARQHPELVKFILDECKSGSQNVKLPSIVWSGNCHQKRLLFEALIEGDGSVSRDGFKYHTCSKQLADDVSRLAFELGYKVTQRFYEKKKENWMDRHVVYITNRSSEWLMPKNHQSIPYNGNVYCLTVPTGAYVTRRNGSVAITGNSAHFFNKTYNGLSVYRDFDTNEVTVYVPKVKYKFIGKIGSCVFQYDRDTGRYSDELGAPFENEFDRYLTKESQAEIHFEEDSPPQREPGQLTDISKLPVGNSFDYQQRESAPF